MDISISDSNVCICISYSRNCPLQLNSVAFYSNPIWPHSNLIWGLFCYAVILKYIHIELFPEFCKEKHTKIKWFQRIERLAETWFGKGLKCSGRYWKLDLMFTKITEKLGLRYNYELYIPKGQMNETLEGIDIDVSLTKCRRMSCI